MADWRAALMAMALCLPAPGLMAGTESPRRLDATTLLRGAAGKLPVPMAAFTPSDNALTPLHRFEGELEFTVPTTAAGFNVLRDDFGYAADSASDVRRLPPFKFSFIQSGDQLIPVTRGLIASTHPHWEWVLEPGRVWQEPSDEGYSRAALPFSLVQRGENCTHNGVMSFLFTSDGSVSQVAFQIASETCLYFKFDLWGQTSAHYAPGQVVGGAQLVADHHRQVSRRMPIQPIEALSQAWPGADPAKFAGSGAIDPLDMTVYGIVIDGINYVGGCQTRLGVYPFCEMLDLPSYSLAKSLVAGLGVMRLAKLYPQIGSELIAEHVPECAATGNWQTTSFENALDMATGNFTSAVYNEDEAAAEKAEAFFERATHSAKIAFACGHYPRRAAPGGMWVYHTSDTYVLGTAINHFLTVHAGPDTDFFEDILLPWWQPLHLSPTSKVSRRTYDQTSQSFTGYGLTLQVDDIAKLASFANGELIRSEVDTTLLDAALQRNGADRGLPASDGEFYYNHGFWAYPGYRSKSCREPIYLPFMLGYGGINVVLMPNATVYYYFSDGGSFGWLDAARESDRIKPFCPQKKESGNER